MDLWKSIIKFLMLNISKVILRNKIFDVKKKKLDFENTVVHYWFPRYDLYLIIGTNITSIESQKR